MTSGLSAPQLIYLGAVGCYLLFFALFLRLFWWKRYADKHYWRRRPSLTVDSLQQLAVAQNQALPRFSIMVPARSEAEVIERTVDHMADLQYPPELYEVMVVTDEKEALAAEHCRAGAVSTAALSIRHGMTPPGTAKEAHSLVLALLGTLALEGVGDVQRLLGPSDGLHLLRQIPDLVLRPLIWEAADRLLRRGGKRAQNSMVRLLRHRLPESGDEELQGAYGALLSLAIPAAVAYSRLRGDRDPRLGAKLAAVAARAHHSLTRELIQAMSESLAATLAARLEAAAREPGLLETRLSATFREIYPTTQDIMERKMAEFQGRTGVPALKHIVVPRDFDGELGGRQLGVEVPSTKGRALNWGLSHIDGRSTWCGFYDAESRPDARSLLYVAYRVLESRADGRPEPRIFQGPVFQVRNWYEMGPFCKIASLYQAIAHDWYLPALFRRLPFVGGTNLYIETRLLKEEIRGYDSSSLTEDLELGTRAYLTAGAWPEYLPYPSSEQTPPTFAGFYRQRLRWATGHLQVMAKIKADTGCDEEKRRRLLKELWRKGQGEWIFYQAATIVPPVIVILWFFDLVDPNVLGQGWHIGMNALSTVYLGFTVYAFFRYIGHLDQTSRPRRWLGQMGALAQLLVLPLAAFLFPVPYSSALVLATLGRGPSGWVKTPRTRE